MHNHLDDPTPSSDQGKPSAPEAAGPAVGAAASSGLYLGEARAGDYLDGRLGADDHPMPAPSSPEK